MTSTNLTQGIRDRICADMLRHRFGAEYSSMAIRRAAFADEVYNAVYSAPTRAKIDALDDGWLREDVYIKVQFGSSYCEIRFDGGFQGSLNRAKPRNEVSSRKTRRLLAKDYGRCIRVFEATNPIAKKYEVLSADLATKNQAVDEAETKILAALESFRTTKRLLDAWPEATPFVDAVFGSRAVAPSLRFPLRLSTRC